MDLIWQILIVVALVVVFVVTYLLNKKTKSDNSEDDKINLCAGCQNTSCTRQNKNDCEEKEDEK